MIAPADVERIAEAVCAHMSGQLPQLLTVAQVAERLAVEPAWVYANADDLGAIRIGGGSKPRLRFDPRTVAEYLNAGPRSHGSQPTDPASTVVLQRRRRRQGSTSASAVPGKAAE